MSGEVPWGRLRFGVRRSAGTVVVGVAVFLAAMVVASTAAAQVSQGTARLRGTVTDPEGNALENVRVVLTHVASGDSVETTTDEDGRWLKGGLGSGTWYLDFYAEGYPPLQISTEVSTVRRMSPIEVAMEAETRSAGSPETPLGRAIRAGNDFYEAGLQEQALQAFETILAEFPAEQNPTVYLVHVNAGNAALELERYELAREHYSACLQVEPANSSALIGIAKSYLAERRLDEGLTTLEQIDLATIEDPIVFYNVGVLLSNEGQPEEAAKYLATAVERNAEFHEARIQLAICMVRIGDLDGARAQLAKVIELAPDSESAALARDLLASIRT